MEGPGRDRRVAGRPPALHQRPVHRGQGTEGEEIRLRLTAADSTGLRLEKTYELRPDERLVRVRYRFASGSQEPARLWVRGFFCKIGDEIAPEDLPAYSRAAGLARRAGWRPFTTVTGLVARSTADLDRLNPDCDQWQVSLSLKDDFRQWRGTDPGDEVWFYGGSSQPYRTPYEAALVYPLLAAVEGVQGYGWWAFYWWQESEKIVWYDPGSAVVRVGPAWLGLRDGWEDARLYSWVVNKERRLAPETWEVYRWTTITGLQSPIAVNAMRRVLLQAAVGRR